MGVLVGCLAGSRAVQEPGCLPAGNCLQVGNCHPAGSQVVQELDYRQVGSCRRAGSCLPEECLGNLPEESLPAERVEDLPDYREAYLQNRLLPGRGFESCRRPARRSSSAWHESTLRSVIIADKSGCRSVSYYRCLVPLRELPRFLRERVFRHYRCWLAASWTYPVVLWEMAWECSAVSPEELERECLLAALPDYWEKYLYCWAGTGGVVWDSPVQD